MSMGTYAASVRRAWSASSRMRVLSLEPLPYSTSAAFLPMASTIASPSSRRIWRSVRVG